MTNLKTIYAIQRELFDAEMSDVIGASSRISKANSELRFAESEFKEKHKVSVSEYKTNLIRRELDSYGHYLKDDATKEEVCKWFMDRLGLIGLI